MSIVQQTPPDFTGSIRVDFAPNEFSSAVWIKGQEVILERAVRCPCHQGEVPRNTCQNCGGLGFAFVDQLQTKILIQGMNVNHQNQNWSEKDLGTLSFTVMAKDRVAWMDRITVLKSKIVFSELCNLHLVGNELIGKTIYKPLEFTHVLVYVNDTAPLVSLPSTDITVIDNKITVTGGSLNYLRSLNIETISLRYFCHPSFHVVDMSRETMNSDVLQSDGQDVNYTLPTRGMMRRAHYIFDRWLTKQAQVLVTTTDYNEQTQGVMGDGDTVFGEDDIIPVVFGNE